VIGGPSAATISSARIFDGSAMVTDASHRRSSVRRSTLRQIIGCRCKQEKQKTWPVTIAYFDDKKGADL
jgi:hypothetical protein